MAKDTKPAAGLVALIANAGPLELDQIKQRQAEIEGAIGTLENERRALASLEKTIERKLSGRPAASGRVGQQTERRDKIEDLLGDGTPRPARLIAKQTKIPIGSMHALLADERFLKTDTGWTLSGKAS